MSNRSSIVDVLVNLFKGIDGTGTYNTNLYENVKSKLIFWDEVSDWPLVCVVAGAETREYLPANFKWGYLTVPIKIYVNADNAQEQLENILEDIEYVIEANETFIYTGNKTIQEIQVVSITTDEGLLHPDGVGEIIIQLKYEI